MHKLKNKHTGEVITTPYMAEVEEYLKSGDFEMSDKKYPYIGKGQTGNLALVYASGKALHIEGKYKGDIVTAYRDKNVQNITREYLTNTYGKCESQEHADFICELAENAGFKILNNYSDMHWRFKFDSEGLLFFGCVFDGPLEKLIHLPLPPNDIYVKNKTIKPNEKGSEMWIEAETKPIYTKEMHGRGELPPVGSEVEYPSGKGVVVLNKPDDSGIIIVSEEFEGDLCYKRVALSGIEPIPTIEDDLFDRAAKLMDRELTQAEFVFGLMDKYNITPKDS